MSAQNTPPDSELDALFEAERACSPPSPEVEARVLARIKVTLAGGGSGSGPEGDAGAGQSGRTSSGGASSRHASATLKILGALLGGGLVVAAAIWAWPPTSSGQGSDHETRPTAVSLEGATATPVAADSAATTSMEAVDAGVATAEPAVTLGTAPVPSGAPGASSSAQRAPATTGARQKEVSILERARLELKNRRPRAALVLLDRHGQLYPSGILRQEREALRIEALAALGNSQESKRSAERFREEFPDSPQRQHLDQVDGGQ